MARRRKTVPTLPTTALVASAARFSGGRAARIFMQDKSWQAECYRHYGICGEARFAAKMFGHSLSKVTLAAAKRTSEGPVHQTEGQAYDALEELFNGAQGQAQMMESIGTHLTIAGECYLVGRTIPLDPAKPNGETDEVWEIVSVLEMMVTGDKWSIRYDASMADVPLTDDDVVIRIWNPSPGKRIEADSPFRSLLPILSEIEWLTRHIFAQTTSRLTGAGLLVMPQSVTFPPPPASAGKENVLDNEPTKFMKTLGNSMVATIQDPGLPSALVPIVITVPDDAVDKIKLLNFWSPLDEHALAMRGEAIRRFALGMDLPPEQVLGMGSSGGSGGGRSNGVSHWGAWQIEESTIKLHIEPMCETVINALTMFYLRPLTDDPTDLVIYSTAELRLRPDRSKESLELYDRGAITLEVMLRENGFDIKDAPSGKDLSLWLLKKLAIGSATPNQVAAAARALGVDIPSDDGGQAGEPAPETPQPPTLEDHPTSPRTPDEGAAAILAASNALVYRALERVGNRLRGNGARPACESYETHVLVNGKGKEPFLLGDAWSCAPQVLGADAERITPLLNSYVETLIATQSEHSMAKLEHWLNRTLAAA